MSIWDRREEECARVENDARDSAARWSDQQRRLVEKVGGNDIAVEIEEAAWEGAVRWLRSDGPSELPCDGGPDDAQGEYDAAITAAAERAVARVGFDLEVPGVREIVWGTVYDVKAEDSVATSCAAFGGNGEESAIASSIYGKWPITKDSAIEEIEARWKELLPDTPMDEARPRFRWPPGEFNAYAALAWELVERIYSSRTEARETVQQQYAEALIKALGVEGLAELWDAQKSGDDDAEKALLDKATAYDRDRVGRLRSTRSYVECRPVQGRAPEISLMDGKPTIIGHREFITFQFHRRWHRLSSPGRQNSGAGSASVSTRFTCARQRDSRGSATRTRGSRRVTSRSAGGGSSGDPDPEPEARKGAHAVALPAAARDRKAPGRFCRWHAALVLAIGMTIGNLTGVGHANDLTPLLLVLLGSR